MSFLLFQPLLWDVAVFICKLTSLIFPCMVDRPTWIYNLTTEPSGRGVKLS